MEYEKVRSRWFWPTLCACLFFQLTLLACTDASVDSAADTAAEASAGPPDPNAPPAGRLSGDVRPSAYRLDLLLDPRRDDFEGTVEIDVVLDRPSDVIWLHGRGLDVAEAAARLLGPQDSEQDEGQTVSAMYTEELPTGVAAVRFDDELPAGEATLTLSYRAAFDRNLAGLFKVEEQGDAYVLAKSESIQARGYLPSFDEPGMKATFDIRLTIPEGHVAIGNEPEVERRPADGQAGYETVTFATTPPMSTFLLSLAVGPFDVQERPAIAPGEFRDRPIPLRGVARRGRAEELGYILDITPRMVEVFERELRRPYPFRKLDVVAAPAWPSGATELSGAITYREQIILAGDDPPPGARRRLIAIHAHEIAHMWFGNLVTPQWWDDLWLKEGFATWASPVALKLFEPDGGHELDAAAQAIGAMTLDSLASTRAIREPIAKNENVRSAYDAITYSKSLGVIHMVDQYFGAERFRPALGRYVETFADQAASADDFYRVIGEETATPELTDTFRSFVEQKGVPLLDVTLRCEPEAGTGDGPALRVAQRRYAPLGSPIEARVQSWSVPFCFRTSGGHSQCEMLTEPVQTLTLDDAECPTWVLPNAGGDGYYRWNLDADGWTSLLDHWHELAPEETLYVIDSAFAAFEAGTLAPETLIPVIERSTESSRRRIVGAPIAYLKKYLQQYVEADDRTETVEYFTALYRPVFERVADSKDSEERLTEKDVLTFLALDVQDPKSRRLLMDKVHAFTGFGDSAPDPKALDSDLYVPALTVAVQDSEGEFLAHLLAFREEFDDPRFRMASATAIGRVSDPEQAGVVHELALTDGTDPREVVALLQAASYEPTQRDRHWPWIHENFPQLVDRMPAQWRHLTPSLGSDFCSAEDLETLRSLFVEHDDLVPGFEKKLSQTEESIGLCIALRIQGRAFVESVRQASSG